MNQEVNSPLNGHPAPEHKPEVSYSIGDYSVFRVSHSNPEHRKILHRVVVCALQFIDQYNAETDPQWLVNLIYNNFKQRTDHVFILVAVDSSGNIVAHSISYVDWYQNFDYVAQVLQAEKSKEIEGREFWLLTEKLTEEWGRSLGLKNVFLSARSEAHARLYGQHGYSQFRTVMRKDIG